MAQSAPTTFLLTGATGFLGSNLLRALLRQNARVIALKRTQSDTWRVSDVAGACTWYDLDQVPVEEIVAGNAIDVIVHCATDYGRRAVQPTEVIAANLTLPLRLLQAAAGGHVRAFVNTDTVLDKRVSYYSLSKRHFADWMTFFAEQFVCVNVALEHFYGPLDDRSKFVTRIVCDVLQETAAIDLTPGLQKRDFIYIDDVVAAFERIFEFAMQTRSGYHHFEVGTNVAVPIRDFVAMVKRLTGNTATELRFGALPYRENEVMESHVDTSRLRGLGWAPQTALEEGLRRTIAVERSRLAACVS